MRRKKKPWQVLFTGEKTLIANGTINIADIPDLITIKAPPLRIRREDVAELFRYNLKLICRQRQALVPILIPEAKRRLERSVDCVDDLKSPKGWRYETPCADARFSPAT